MGLIRAAAGAVGGTMADQWREFFYCEAMDADTLVVKGQKQVGRRSSNTKGSENIISNGSGIAVADGQCMMIVEQGKIVEVCAEPGEFTYDSSTEPSIFTGKLGEGLKKTFATFGKRFTYGGDTGKDQRVYYINTKEIMDNKFGTANPFLFHVVDHNTGLSRDVQVRCNGIYSYRITDPILFYKNVCGNVEMTYDREEIDGQLKTEFISALQPAFAQLSRLELLPSDIPAHAGDLEEAMNEALTKKWAEKRGISVVSVAMNPITLKEEDLKKIQEIQDAARSERSDDDGGNAWQCTGRSHESSRIQSKRCDDGLYGTEYGRRSWKCQYPGSSPDGKSETAGTKTAAVYTGRKTGPADTSVRTGRKLAVQLRSCKYRQILHGMRNSKAGRGLEMQLRGTEQR